MFGNDIRAIVPHLSLCRNDDSTVVQRNPDGPSFSYRACRSQILGVPAHAVVEEFNRARNEITANPSTIPLWQPIIAKYTPTLVGECEKAIEWSNKLVRNWLSTGMFAGDPDADQKIEQVMKELADHAFNKSHSRHISLAHAQDIGLKAKALEKDQELQEKVLSVYHSYVLSASETGLIKIIENHEGVTFANVMQVMAMPVPQQASPGGVPAIPPSEPEKPRSPNRPGGPYREDVSKRSCEP